MRQIKKKEITFHFRTESIISSRPYVREALELEREAAGADGEFVRTFKRCSAC